IFTVSDTGIGIPKDKTHRLFEVFSQLHTQVYQPSEGLGLGLSIVKNLIKMMNGSIRVESEENVGTQFTVRIPVLLETHIANQTDKFNQMQFRNISPENIYILIAEDDPINQILIRRNMEKYKIRYDLVHNGLQAVELYEKNNYNLILMDIQMPEMDGYAATQIIKQSEKYKLNPAPVIAMTAFAMKGDREQFIEKGMDEYISKPINFEKLIQLMEKI
ncbi:MAG: response regulator, partial [Bacteroidota bacterium]